MVSPVPPNLDEVPLGTRVVVRHLIEGGERATDALGALVARTQDTVVVDTRAGEVTIARGTVVAAKPVPRRPWRLASYLRGAGVAVLDLDGVVRTFDTDGMRTHSERELGLARHSLLEIAFDLPEARDMVIGAGTYAAWVTALGATLRDLGHPADLVDRVIDRWEADAGTPITPTLALMDELAGEGIPTFVFTNGADRVPEELERIGLGHLVPWLLNSHHLGFAKPAPEAYAVAHAQIEQQLGRTVGRAEVRFTDDRVANVEAARDFGWGGHVFTLPR